MATGTKRRARTVPDVVVEPEQPAQPERKVIPGIAPGETDDEGYYVPTGATRRIKCPLFEGLDLTVLYLPSVAYAFTREDYWLPGVTSPLENECRKMAMFVRGFEGWKFRSVTGEVIPVPSPDDWQSYVPICAIRGELGELYGWLMGAGLTEALRASSKNS